MCLRLIWFIYLVDITDPGARVYDLTQAVNGRKNIGMVSESAGDKGVEVHVLDKTFQSDTLNLKIKCQLFQMCIHTEI